MPIPNYTTLTYKETKIETENICIPIDIGAAVEYSWKMLKSLLSAFDFRFGKGLMILDRSDGGSVKTEIYFRPNLRGYSEDSKHFLVVITYCITNGTYYINKQFDTKKEVEKFLQDLIDLIGSD